MFVEGISLALNVVTFLSGVENCIKCQQLSGLNFTMALNMAVNSNKCTHIKYLSLILNIDLYTYINCSKINLSQVYNQYKEKFKRRRDLSYTYRLHVLFS